jgi:hypothetical protein
MNIKKQLLTGVVAIALAVLAGLGSTNVAAQQPSQTFSVVVHIEYPSGFVYEHAFATGVAEADLSTYLAACAKGHAHLQWLRYLCFPVPE